MKSDSSSDAAGLNTLQDLLSEIGILKERISRHSILLEEEAGLLINDVSNMRGEVVSQKKSLESMMNEFARLASKEKDMEISVLRQSIALLFEACEGSIMEIESGKAQIFGNVSAVGYAGDSLKSLALPDRGTSFNTETLSEEVVKDLTNRLLFAVQDFIGILENSVGGQHNELRNTISQLQKELQKKDAQNERIHSELVSQIKEAKSAAAKYAQDLEYAKTQVLDSVSRFNVMEKERNLLEQKLVDLQQKHVISMDLQEKVKSLTEMLASKEQEAEALMQVLDEDENQMEGLRSKIQEMEEVIKNKNLELQNLESSRAKAMKKLMVTVTKFDELHHMSEDLLSEIENLQSQLQERDSEISFLRQEVTRCTNDVLSASKMTKERSSAGLNELLAWLDGLCSRALMRDVQMSDSSSQGEEYKERLQKDIESLVSELEGLRIVAQSKDALLNAERDRVRELLLRKEAVEVSLRQKETELSVRGDRDSGEASEIVEVEPLIKKWSVPVTSTASQVRSLRKANNDHVISIDADAGDTGRLQDEDDDKMHGFKSLTTSRLVPKFTRPLSDMVDGLWVSCDRALMRQPAFRLGNWNLSAGDLSAHELEISVRQVRTHATGFGNGKIVNQCPYIALLAGNHQGFKISAPAATASSDPAPLQFLAPYSGCVLWENISAIMECTKHC
ncbi:Trans-Golgi network-localized SYP41-interacting protein 1-like protein [Drosera capensis]